MKPVRVVGGGLAGSEAAWQIASAGLPVILTEMRPLTGTPAHKTDGLAELVCSNSFRSDDAENNAVGVLHQEMRLAGSLVMASADSHQLPAGSALAVDRDAFSAAVTQAIAAHPLITVERGEVNALPAPGESVIIATGPLTSDSLSAAIREASGEDQLAFFDAIAPIVHRDSVDMDTAWFQSRYDKPGPGGDTAAYLNCPLSRPQYEAFIDALLAAETADFRDWEKDTPYFEGCLPIEVMAARGRETLRYGPMKPVGLTNRHKPDEKPWAVVQLRQDNRQGSLFNMVGFQTKMKYGEQAKAFRLIPGLQNAEFARLGGIHRNTFLRSPKILDASLRMKAAPHIRFAGQITGCEGYVESAAVGLMAGRFAVAEARGAEPALPPETSAHGALLAHITGRSLLDPDADFQPMNVNFGLFPEIETPQADAEGRKIKGKERGFARKRILARRALADFAAWIERNGLKEVA
ncbi:methylenetetrahydrofolate--tRNA-(uracil(54)-C(5))-methyltransferase (FADH(2)-oxidizing) TrmFO [Afifella sp. IM 167]|uniref:methylenetetrahydrofolate--tRNA-(uracil(54)- C(5))-methyltransferase (FADH(2)-oxidizing) TrmFO n=1 Tax=Afifella sp. IM 167 TaxID=2033586 RepID=UPI001CCFD75F|nr:methylenetetrahydrofolate--tRNA-(uracil(54)-C(5))-methyltransferase (FADH(2)-oxidizing) TrmFO [Afifella sp. IM 167]MBZ8132546.1 methylenetetrahydrofolate--tRNA-(uracil(54)-C(5))-methyltransferase (FADH(2)-oxidizing) TrmFO [Afifella sp. IM 167]